MSDEDLKMIKALKEKAVRTQNFEIASKFREIEKLIREKKV